jgi:hypothetical protein
MEQTLDRTVSDFEEGRMNRRQLVSAFAVLVAPAGSADAAGWIQTDRVLLTTRDREKKLFQEISRESIVFPPIFWSSV